MTQTCAITLLFLAVLSADLQVRKPANVCRLESKYDHVADTTSVQCNLVELEGRVPRLIVQANASFRGKEPNETAKFRLGLHSYIGKATRHTQPLFQEATKLYLDVDSARLEIPVEDYRKDFFELNGLLTEQARAEISREDLRKLQGAKTLEGAWGGVAFKFSDAALASLKDFISRQVFAADAR